MDDNSTIGIIPEHKTELCNSSSGFEFCALLLILAFSGFGNSNSSADYWRGKYDALKETMEKEPNE